MKTQWTVVCRLFTALVLVVALAPLVACNWSSSKPSAEECKAAIENIRKIRGTASDAAGTDPRKAVRSCQGNSSKETVKCFSAAKTVEDIVACEGDTGEKYFDEEKKAREEIERKLKEKEAKEAENKDGTGE